MADVLFLTVLVPIIAALLVLFISPSAKGVIRGVGLLGAMIPLIFALLAYIDYQTAQSGLQYPFALTWLQVPNAWLNMPLTVQFGFAADGISMPLILLVGVVSLMAAIRSFRVENRVKSHYFWQMLLVSGLYGVFGANDLFTLFFFLEVTLVACYFLIGIFGNERRHYAATKFLIYRGVASVVLLAGF
ncbi:MAG: proton-conducting transporter membrane subunit, partial [Firmicutes bacterium]|nr:proton-conducting transporter membrane subunit [Bacillota bacterium]